LIMRRCVGSCRPFFLMYAQSFLVTCVRGMGLEPTTCARALSGCTGCMNAALGVRLVVVLRDDVVVRLPAVARVVVREVAFRVVVALDVVVPVARAAVRVPVFLAVVTVRVLRAAEVLAVPRVTVALVVRRPVVVLLPVALLVVDRLAVARVAFLAVVEDAPRRVVDAFLDRVAVARVVVDRVVLVFPVRRVAVAGM